MTMTREQFIDYLTDRLIPDLRISGHELTADDFETAVNFLTDVTPLRPTVLRDSTYNFHPDCANDEHHITYGRGVLVGLVGGFMAMGLGFKEALQIVKAHSRDCVSVCIPDAWKPDWDKLPYSAE